MKESERGNFLGSESESKKKKAVSEERKELIGEKKQRRSQNLTKGVNISNQRSKRGPLEPEIFTSLPPFRPLFTQNNGIAKPATFHLLFANMTPSPPTTKIPAQTIPQQNPLFPKKKKTSESTTSVFRFGKTRKRSGGGKKGCEIELGNWVRRVKIGK